MTRASPHSGPHLTIEDRHRDLLLMVNNNEHVTWERSLPDESRCEVQAGTYVTAEVTVQGSRTRGRPRKFAISAEEQRDRRRAQNRKAQRTYRERKDRLIGELQMQICALQQQNSQLHGVQNPLELQQANSCEECMNDNGATDPPGSENCDMAGEGAWEGSITTVLSEEMQMEYNERTLEDLMSQDWSDHIDRIPQLFIGRSGLLSWPILYT
ncbi:hypothetical protein BFJ70_g15204 [Fusarium oxysporum]|nr:hypothetical protein BFJ70_g15204 [Fusarium oxysporum]